MSWHYLQGQEAASWAGDCLDGASDALLSLIPTGATCSWHDRPRGSSSDSPCGTTCAPSTGDPGEGTSMSSPGGSPVRTSALPGKALASRGSARGFGGKCIASFAKWDPDTSCWRTSQPSLIEDSTRYSGRWPLSGSMRNGACYRRSKLEPLTDAPVCGWSHLWPTPIARDWRSGKVSKTTLAKNSRPLSEVVQQSDGGPLNPTWVEWLMGWPLGWTASEPLGTGRFQKWLEQHGICSLNDSEPLDTTQRRGR
jgi:hypothetical protein